MKLRRLLAPAAGLASILAWAPPARAHLVNTGFGPFYDGLVHPFLTPEDLLPVVALTLLAGLRGPRFGRTVLYALPMAWLVGTGAGRLLASHALLSAAIVAVPAIVLGALVAADRELPLALVVGLAIALGLVNGVANGVELARASAQGLGAVGVACSLFVVVALGAGQVSSLRAPWARVVVRVAGSWIAAIGLLMFGWSVRGG